MHFCALINPLICVNMNEQVQKFLEEQKKKAKKERNNHLGKLGLYDFEKCKKVYVEIDENFANDDTLNAKGYFKDEKGWFKIEGPKYVLSVSDEEYEEICKYCPVIKKDGFSEALLDKVDSIRKMVKFFTILMIISLVLAVILGMIIGLKPSYY